jgi:hypothetical protein
MERGGFSTLHVAELLEKQGICILENYLTHDQVVLYQELVDRLIKDLERKAPSPRNAYNPIIDITEHTVFADLVLDEFILTCVEAYYGRPVYLCCARGGRIYPKEPCEYGAFRWHHDTKGKWVKAMWLLTDVPSTGQRMSYIPGSHKLRHPWDATPEQTRFTREQALAYGEILECAAPAGSVIIFDQYCPNVLK